MSQHKTTVDPVDLVETISELSKLVEEGILPDNSRIAAETKAELRKYVASGMAIAIDPRSIQYDYRLAILRLTYALGEAGFFGPKSRF